MWVSMLKKWNNLVARGLLLVLLVALGLPCASCEDDVASPARHHAVVSAHASSSDHPAACQCVSCKPKVNARKAMWCLPIAVAVSPVTVQTFAEPESVDLAFQVEVCPPGSPPVPRLPSDRAPPIL